MAKTLSRSTTSRVFYRFFSTSTSRSVSPSLLPSNLISRRSSPSLFHLVGLLTRFTTIRTHMDSSSCGSYSPLESISNFSDQPPTEDEEMDPDREDYKHWVIVLRKKPGGKNGNKQQMVDCYVQTLAKFVGSEEEAKRKIYKVSCTWWFGFGCEIDEELSEKLEELPEVKFVYRDSYVDPEYKDYGAELCVNGELVPRPPERQRRITPESDVAPLYDGLDHEHWVIEIKKHCLDKATKEQMIDCYVQTLAKIVGSEEEAKRKIYKVSCEGWFCFGCEIDEETAHKLFDLPEVLFTFPDEYVDPGYKDYGAELFVNGEVVMRPPERQRRIMIRESIKNAWRVDHGLDFKHWRIHMGKKFGGENATKQQMIDCYVQTLAKIVGSEEEAKRKIYKVSCEGWFGFGCEIDEEISEKLHELPEVGFVFPDEYVDPVYKDYGAELFANGELVTRSPERQGRITVLNDSIWGFDSLFLVPKLLSSKALLIPFF